MINEDDDKEWSDMQRLWRCRLCHATMADHDAENMTRIALEMHLKLT